MAPRANWKGFLRLSLVCLSGRAVPSRSSESEKISFNQLNQKTGHRIKYMRVDADTGDEVAKRRERSSGRRRRRQGCLPRPKPRKPRAPRLKPRPRRRSRKRGGETCRSRRSDRGGEARPGGCDGYRNQRPIGPLAALASPGKLIAFAA